MPPVTVVVTMGPSVSRACVLKAASALGHIIFRVNGAWGSIEEIGRKFASVRKHLPDVETLLDLPGRKIRFSNLRRPLRVSAGRAVALAANQFTYPDLCGMMRAGDRVITNDGVLHLEVVKAGRRRLVLMPESDGTLYSGKGVHVGDCLERLPLFSGRDELLLTMVPRWSPSHVALSFIASGADVDLARTELSRIGKQVELVPKIETAEAVRNLKEILARVTTVLVDRGDLASEIGLENLPAAQDTILRACQRSSVNVIVATQLLKSMQRQRIPLIAELTELYRLLDTGVYGLQLSEETAVGRHPIECIRLIMDMSRRLTRAGMRARA